jgi:prephenate dehydratase
MSRTVAFQGVLGAYSEQAARSYFGAGRGATALAVKPLPDFPAVFRAVASGRVAFGVLPIENTLAGSIHQNFDLLATHPVEIVGEVKLRVEHCLLALPKARLADVTHVYSHPQALAQCAGRLKALRHVTATPFFDTAGSAEHVARTGDVHLAAIASEGAAARYGLRILRRNLEDDPSNFTRFLVVRKVGENPAKRPATPRARQGRGAAATRKTSVVFALRDVPGALYKGLSVFALRDINIVRIESRPIPGQPWQYRFYLDFLAPDDPVAAERALASLAEISSVVRVLGTYVAA